MIDATKEHALRTAYNAAAEADYAYYSTHQNTETDEAYQVLHSAKLAAAKELNDYIRNPGNHTKEQLDRASELNMAAYFVGGLSGLK